MQVILHGGEPVLDLPVLFRVLVAETQVLQCLFDAVQSQAVSQRGIDVERLAGYLVLLVGQLAPQGAHVVQAVAYLDEDDAYVLAHGEQQFLEGLGLYRSLVTEDTTRYLGESIHDLGYLVAEDVAYVLYGVVGILHHVMEQGTANAGAAQSDFLTGYLSHGDGVHDVGFAREPPDPLVSLPRKVERLVDDLRMLAVSGVQIRIYEVLVRLVHHPLLVCHIAFCHDEPSLRYFTIFSFWLGLMRSPLSPLSLRNLATVVPLRAAIWLSVSPFLTVTVLPVPFVRLDFRLLVLAFLRADAWPTVSSFCAGSATAFSVTPFCVWVSVAT